MTILITGPLLSVAVVAFVAAAAAVAAVSFKVVSDYYTSTAVETRPSLGCDTLQRFHRVSLSYSFLLLLYFLIPLFIIQPSAMIIQRTAQHTRRARWTKFPTATVRPSTRPSVAFVLMTLA